MSPLEARRHTKPALIAGDLDSISDEVRQFYRQEGTRIVDLSHDQDSTDLQKCLCELEKQFDAEQLSDVTIIAAGQSALHWCWLHILSTSSSACIRLVLMAAACWGPLTVSIATSAPQRVQCLIWQLKLESSDLPVCLCV